MFLMERPFSTVFIYIMMQFYGTLVSLFSCSSHLFFLQCICIMFCTNSFSIITHLAIRLLIDLFGLSFISELFSKTQYSRENREVRWINHWLRCPRSTGRRLAQLWWSIGRHSAFTSLQAQGHCPLFRAAFGKEGMSLPSLIKFCVHSQGFGMPPSLPS